MQPCNFSASYTTSDFGFLSDGSGGSYLVVEQPAPPTLWTSASGGSWTTAADWSTGAMPTSATDVLIGVPGSYTVTVTSAGAAAKSLTVNDPNATIEIDSAASLAVSNDVNAGTVNLIGHASGANMTVGGNFINTGTVGVDDYEFFFSSGGSTLTISGTLHQHRHLQLGNDYRGNIDTTAPAYAHHSGGSPIRQDHARRRSGAQATLDRHRRRPAGNARGQYPFARDCTAGIRERRIATVAAAAVSSARVYQSRFIAVRGQNQQRQRHYRAFQQRRSCRVRHRQYTHHHSRRRHIHQLGDVRPGRIASYGPT